MFVQSLAIVSAQEVFALTAVHCNSNFFSPAVFPCSPSLWPLEVGKTGGIMFLDKIRKEKNTLELIVTA